MIFNIANPGGGGRTFANSQFHSVQIWGNLETSAQIRHFCFNKLIVKKKVRIQLLFKQQPFCFKRCWHAPYLDNVGKSLVSRQSWCWTTLPRKPVYVKATKPLAHSLFSFFPVHQKLTSDSCCRTPSPPSQNTQRRLTLPQELWFLSLEAMSVFGTETWILLGIPMMLPVCLCH